MAFFFTSRFLSSSLTQDDCRHGNQEEIVDVVGNVFQFGPNLHYGWIGRVLHDQSAKLPPPGDGASN